MRSRVMPGSSVTMERRVPVRRLNNVDLPTLGRPAITMDGNGSDITQSTYRIACDRGLDPYYFGQARQGKRKKFFATACRQKKRPRGYGASLALCLTR